MSTSAVNLGSNERLDENGLKTCIIAVAHENVPQLSTIFCTLKRLRKLTRTFCNSEWKSYLDDPDNEKSLIEALDEVCQNVPSSFAMECQDMVDTYGTELLKYAETLLDPNFVCEKLALCGERPIEPKKQMIVGANSCTFGPSHWCANHDNAKSCKATDYCVQNGLLEPEK